MASITKQAGKWRAQVYVNGKRRSKLFAFKADAAKWAAAAESELAEIPSQISPDTTLGDLWAAWQKLYLHKRNQPKYESNRLKFYGADPIASVKLSELSGKHVAEWRDRRLKEVSAGTVLRDWGQLSAICETAVREMGWLKANPFRQAKRPAEPKSRDRIATAEELEMLLIVLRENLWRIVQFAIETAMRAGEICGLTWEHVDLKKRTAHLPKTKNGDARTVPLSTKAVEVMGPAGEGSVFNMKVASMDALWRRALSKTPIVDLHFHDLRHTAITRLAKKMPVLALARMVGHRNINQLLCYYNESAEELAKLLD